MPRTPPTLGSFEDFAPPLPPLPPRHRRRRAWRWLLLLALAPVVASHVLVLALRWLPPPTTAFMLQSPTQPVHYRWVDAGQMAPAAARAVVAAEDQRFFDHGGLDFEAIEKAIEHNQNNRRKRGASTISQQVAKNLFLWEGRSWLRKGLEVYATLLIEWLWGKDRILEVYLNVAEFGPGIYGVEAAAQHNFKRPAAQLQPEQAARLAAVLPSPRRWKVLQPGPFVLKRSAWILRQMGYRQGPAPADRTTPALAPAASDDADDGFTDSPAAAGLPEAPGGIAESAPTDAADDDDADDTEFDPTLAGDDPVPDETDPDAP